MESFACVISKEDMKRLGSMIQKTWAEVIEEKMKEIIPSLYYVCDCTPPNHPPLRVFVTDKRMVNLARTAAWDHDNPNHIRGRRLTPFHDKDRFMVTIRFGKDEQQRLALDHELIKEKAGFFGCMGDEILAEFGDSADTSVLKWLAYAGVSERTVPFAQKNALDLMRGQGIYQRLMVAIDDRNTMIYLSILKGPIYCELDWKLQVEAELFSHRNALAAQAGTIAALQEEIERLKSALAEMSSSSC